MNKKEKPAAGRIPERSHSNKFLTHLLLPGLLLPVLFFIAFMIRAAAYSIPAATPEDKPFLQDESGNPYLTEMDSYFYLRKAQEMADEGTIRLFVNRSEDPLIGQRVHSKKDGVTLPLGISALTCLLWRYLFSFAGKSLIQTAIWVGPLLGSTAVLPAFWYVWKRTSLPGGIAAGLLAGCAIPFVIHTHAGFFDTDMVLAVLPLTAILSLIRCMQARSLRQQTLSALLSAAALTAMSLCWRGYYVYLLSMLAGTALSLLLIHLLPDTLFESSPLSFEEGSLFSSEKDQISSLEKEQSCPPEKDQISSLEKEQSCSPENDRPAPSVRKRIALRGGLLALTLTLLLLFTVNGEVILQHISATIADLRYGYGSTDSMPYALAFTSEMRRLSFWPGDITLRSLMGANLSSVLGRMGGVLPTLLSILWLPLALLPALLLSPRRKKRAAAAVTADLSSEEASAAAAVTADLPDEETPAEAFCLPGTGSSPALSVPSGTAQKRLTAEEVIALIPEAALLGFWAIIGVILSCRAKRFAQIPVLPISVLAGLSIGRLFSLCAKRRRGRIPVTLLLFLLLAAATIPSVRGAKAAVRGNITQVTDSKQEAMTWVRENTPESASLASWWDDGYFMEYQAGRRTLADGGTDNAKMNWLLAKVLLTEDPRLAAGILRMLSESGTEALDDLTDTGMEQAEAAELLLRILPLTREEAKAELTAAGIPQNPDPTDNPLTRTVSSSPLLTLLDKTHPEKQDPTLLVLTSDLLFKSNAFTYFAFWDPSQKKQEQTTFLLPTSRSAVLEDGQAEIPMTDSNYTLFLRRNPDGRITAEYQDHENRLTTGQLQVWENGKIILNDRADNTEDHLTAVVVKDGEEFCGVLCTDNIMNCMMIRMLVCEDQSLPQAVRLDTWYGSRKSDSCPAQRRLSTGEMTIWAAQVWQIQ